MVDAQRKLDGHIALAGCALAILALVPVAAYQAGALDHLPDPPLSVFDSDKLTGAKDSFPLGVPDSFVGLASYGATLWLLFAARRRAPVASTLLGVKLAGDAVLAAGNTVRGLVKHGKLCSWCLGTGLGTAVMVVYGSRFLRD